MTAGTEFGIVLIGDGGSGIITNGNDAQGGVTSKLGMVCADFVRTIKGKGGMGIAC